MYTLLYWRLCGKLIWNLFLMLCLKDQLNYRILSGSPYIDLFYLNPVTGQITLKNVLEGRAENQYTVKCSIFIPYFLKGYPAKSKI